MTNQNNRGNSTPSSLSSLISQSKAKYTKGGSSKTSREESIEDDIVQMAEAHAQIVLKAAQFKEFPEVELSESITAVLDQVFAILLPGGPADILSPWENLYKETFWQVLQSARK